MLILCNVQIYTVYQSKLEEHDFFKKGGNKGAKKRTASGGWLSVAYREESQLVTCSSFRSCSSSVDIPPISSLADHTDFHPIPPEQLQKRRCVTIEEGSRYNSMPPELLPQGHNQFYHGWPTHHHVANMESVHDYSSAYLNHNGISCTRYGKSFAWCTLCGWWILLVPWSDERQGSYPVHSRSNEEDLAHGHQFNQYGGYLYDRDRQAPLVSQYQRICKLRFCALRRIAA